MPILPPTPTPADLSQRKKERQRQLLHLQKTDEAIQRVKDEEKRKKGREEELRQRPSITSIPSPALIPLVLPSSSFLSTAPISSSSVLSGAAPIPNLPPPPLEQHTHRRTTDGLRTAINGLYILEFDSVRDIGDYVRLLFRSVSKISRYIYPHPLLLPVGILRIVLYLATCFYLTLAFVYLILCAYSHSYFYNMSIIGWLGFPLSASYISIFCAIPLIPTCDVCGICPTPIRILTPPIASASDDEMHDSFKQTASTTFWDTAISQATVLESLGRELRRRRVPYRRLHNTWKWEFDSKIQARHSKVLEPLHFVITSLDTSAEELIAFQFHVSSSYAILGVNLDFLHSRLGSYKPWYSFSSTLDALGVEYASFAAESIKQLDDLIAHIEKFITRLQQTENSLDKVHQSMKLVDTDRKIDEDAQYFWVRLWWSRSESPHSIEGRDIKGIMNAHHLTLSNLDITVHHLRDKRRAWEKFNDGLSSASKLSSGRTRHAILKHQLNLVETLLGEYKTHSKIASQRVEENLKAAEGERKRGGPIRLESTRYNARSTHI